MLLDSQAAALVPYHMPVSCETRGPVFLAQHCSCTAPSPASSLPASELQGCPRKGADPHQAWLGQLEVVPEPVRKVLINNSIFFQHAHQPQPAARLTEFHPGRLHQVSSRMTIPF
ncbi:hypothetical protein V2G26_016810 [Clonostachys chloroleuca]